MSIIHEALKKVQASFQRSANSSVPESAPAGGPPVGGPPPEEQRAEKPKSNVFAAVIILVVMAGAILFLYKQTIQYWPEICKTFGIDPRSVKMPKKLELPSLSIKVAKTPKLSTRSTPQEPLARLKAGSADENSGDASFQNVLNVQGVMTQGSQTLALINDKIYEAGDEVSGIKILSITNDKITLLRFGKEEVIKVRH